MGYLAYSATQRRANSLPNPEGVKILLNQNDYMLVECFLANRIISKQTVEDVTGLHPGTVANVFREMIRLRCITQSGKSTRNYSLTPAFIRYLATYKHPEEDTYFESDQPQSEIEGDL